MQRFFSALLILLSLSLSNRTAVAGTVTFGGAFPGPAPGSFVLELDQAILASATDLNLNPNRVSSTSASVVSSFITMNGATTTTSQGVLILDATSGNSVANNQDVVNFLIEFDDTSAGFISVRGSFSGNFFDGPIDAVSVFRDLRTNVSTSFFGTLLFRETADPMARTSFSVDAISKSGFDSPAIIPLPPSFALNFAGLFSLLIFRQRSRKTLIEGKTRGARTQLA